MTDRQNADQGNDEEFVEQISRRLELEVADLPDSAVQRLQLIRRQAVAAAERRPGLLVSGRVPALIASAALVALAVFMNFNTDSPIPALPVASEAEFALAQELDLLQQLEFLAWLEEEQPNAG